MRKLIAAILIALTLNLGAATYYIDYVGGNNASAGTSTGTAWKNYPQDTNATGTAASTTVSAGDTFIFKGGVSYMGGWVQRTSGTSGSPIRFDGNSDGTWGTGKAVLDQNYGSNAVGIRISNVVSHIQIDNFEIKNCGGLADDDPIVLAAANGDFGNTTNAWRTPIWGWGIELAGRNTNVYIANCYIHHIGIWHSTLGWDGRSVSGTAIYMSSPSQVTITNCEITKVGATGIGLYSGGGASTSDILVTDCYLHHDIPAWGLDMAPAANGVTFSNIHITKTRFVNLWSNWTGTDDDPGGTGTTAPHQNYIFIRQALSYCTWTNVAISRCFFGETDPITTGQGGTGGIFLSAGPSLDIYNNVFAENWSITGTIVTGYEVTTNMQQRVRIMNNTFIRGTGTLSTSSANDPPDRIRDMFWWNNVFVNPHTNFVGGTNSFNSTMLAIDYTNHIESLNYNLFWSPTWNSNTMYVAVVAGGYKTMTTLRDMGYGSNSIYADPLFIDATNATVASWNLAITTNSPAYLRGTNLSHIFTTDYNGNTRTNSGAWSMGAYDPLGAEPAPSGPTIVTNNASGARVMGFRGLGMRP